MKAVAASAREEGSAGAEVSKRRGVQEGSPRRYVAPELEALQRVILRRPGLELRRLVFLRQDGEK